MRHRSEKFLADMWGISVKLMPVRLVLSFVAAQQILPRCADDRFSILP